MTNESEYTQHRENTRRRISGFHISQGNAEAILKVAERAKLTLEDINALIDEADRAGENRDRLKDRIFKAARNRNAKDASVDQARRSRPKPEPRMAPPSAAVMDHRRRFSDALQNEREELETAPMTADEKSERMSAFIKQWLHDNPAPNGEEAA